MAAYAVVRMRARSGCVDALIERFRAIDRTMPGFRKGVFIKTGERTFCTIGEWESMEHIVQARPVMRKNLDRFRDLLDDLGEGIGQTDPVSGEVVVEMGMSSADRVVDSLSEVGKYVALIDGLGRVLHLPAGLRRHIGNAFEIRQGKLVAARAESHVALAAAIECATGRDGKGSRNVGVVIVRRTDGDRPLFVRIVPITSAAENVFAARAAIVVTDPDELNLQTIAAISETLGLTKAEARLARWIGNGEKLQDIALTEGVTLETARTRLKRVFMKTGTHRQAELAALMAAFAH